MNLPTNPPKKTPPNTAKTQSSEQANFTKEDKTIGAALGGALLGASLFGPVGAIVLGLAGIMAASKVEPIDTEDKK